MQSGACTADNLNSTTNTCEHGSLCAYSAAAVAAAACHVPMCTTSHTLPESIENHLEKNVHVGVATCLGSHDTVVKYLDSNSAGWVSQSFAITMQ